MVVVEERGGLRVPVGLVTDRDVVVEIVATELDPGVITVEDIMEPELACVKDTEGISRNGPVHAGQEHQAGTGCG